MSDVVRPDLEAIQERADKAKPGPWEAMWPNYRHVQAHGRGGFRVCTIPVDQKRPIDDANLKFIAHAREDIPALLAYVRDLERRLAEAEAENAKLKDLAWGIYCPKCGYRSEVARGETEAQP